ncbi:hypothetical protein SCLCIDRAFT_1219011 [Scleroderma citrinum Foug A]|uniref:Uncharacterized protein n=1 Tax=Scleroderma citrinum Foug A TaxID=1036808 RepID=A0A0C2ZZU9_9AGAM|nr:hypothetical protein SCLCIDRAFT_1219011 [Scleroderma citrinum Foug A]
MTALRERLRSNSCHKIPKYFRGIEDKVRRLRTTWEIPTYHKCCAQKSHGPKSRVNS